MNKRTKFIFVTGGVLSGLGKGVSAASLGRLLKARGYKIFVQKFDPYYNPDPGTMSPYQHGEVYVTVDGGETDLDLGHYERFIDEEFRKVSNVTQGRLLTEILAEERAGKYGGNTIQVVPHVTNKIIEKIEEAVQASDADFIITEIGGTVGDIESQPFMYAIAQFGRKNKNDCFFIHATYVPFLESSEEFKSKPSQQSVSLLQSLGIFPDMILLRANKSLDDEFVSKVAYKTMIDKEYTIAVPNVDNIYKIPLHFEEHKMAELVLSKLGITIPKANLTDWTEYVNKINQSKKTSLKIALVGKYVEYEDAYKSIVEALKISSTWEEAKLEIVWISSDNINDQNVAEIIGKVDGIVILPGFGERGFLGKVSTAAYARDKKIPTFGICYGFQAMVVDQAKRSGIKDAITSEVSDKGTFVIDIIAGKNKSEIGGTLRLGASKTILQEGSISASLYNSLEAIERHRHRYEVNPQFVKQIQDEKFTFTGFDETKGFAEVCELKEHPFFIGVQAHPEFNARPLRPHPLFSGFIKAVIKHKK